MDILGISCYYHDAAAVLLRDGQLVAAAEEERFSRIKHDYGFPTNAIKYCLEAGGTTGPDLDYVVFFEKPFRKLDRICCGATNRHPCECPAKDLNGAARSEAAGLFVCRIGDRGKLESESALIRALDGHR